MLSGDDFASSWLHINSIYRTKAIRIYFSCIAIILVGGFAAYKLNSDIVFNTCLVLSLIVAIVETMVHIASSARITADAVVLAHNENKE